MDRRVTTFSTAITAELIKRYEATDRRKSRLVWYQILAGLYFEMNISKGLFLWDHMGFGKTVMAYHIGFLWMEQNPSGKVLIITPRALLTNFQNSRRKYEEFSGDTIDQSRISFVKYSNTTEKQIAQLNPKEIDMFTTMDDVLASKSKKIVETLKNLDGYLIILEEAHMFNRKIANGSKTTVQLYDLMMKSDCRIVMLSGSLIASRPFELAPMVNLLSGENLFPEDESVFARYFIDYQTQSLKNKAIFQDRILGLFSRMKPEYLSQKEAEDYPERLPDQVVKIEFSHEELLKYLGIRETEVAEERAKKKSKRNAPDMTRFDKDKSSKGTYRVRSRQACNFPPPTRLLQYFKDKDYTNTDIEDLIYGLSPDDSISSKCISLANVLTERRGQKGTIYSQFVQFGGALSIANFLLKHGAIEVGVGKAVPKSFPENQVDRKRFPPIVGLKFARINGSLSVEDQAGLLHIFNDPANDHGELLALLILGQEQTMGLDLATTRFGVMWESAFIDFIRDQYLYRMVRKGSHLRLPKAEHNCQMYIFMCVYPHDFDINKVNEVAQRDIDDDMVDVDYAPDMQETTDEWMYEMMAKNARLVDSFKKAVEEVAIECEVVKMMNPEAKHECRLCAPDGQMLYQPDSSAVKSLDNSIRTGTACHPFTKKKIRVEKVIMPNGMEYLYAPYADSIWGYIIYFRDGDQIMEVPEQSAVFKEIIAFINKKKED